MVSKLLPCANLAILLLAPATSHAASSDEEVSFKQLLNLRGYLSTTIIKSDTNATFIKGSSNKFGAAKIETGVNGALNLNDSETLPATLFFGLNYNSIDDKQLINIDYANLNLTKNFDGYRGSYGIGLGRSKVNFGLLNDARINPRARRQVILPHSVYFSTFDRYASRIDGLSTYFTEVFSDESQFSINAGIGKSVATPDSIEGIMDTYYHFNVPGAKLTPKNPVSFISATYEIGDLVLNYSFSPIKWKYHNDLPFGIPAHDFSIQLHQVGAILTKEQYRLTAEALIDRQNSSGGINSSGDALGFFFMGERFISDNITAYGSYSWFNDPTDPKGEAQKKIGVNPLLAKGKDITFGISKQFKNNFTVRAEFHHINGSIWVKRVDVNDSKPVNIMALSIIQEF